MRCDRVEVASLAGIPVKVMVHTVIRDSRQNALAGVNRYSVIHKLVWREYRSRTRQAPPRLDRYAFDWAQILRSYRRRRATPAIGHLVVDEAQNLPPEFFSWARLAARHLDVFADQHQALDDVHSTLKTICDRARLPEPVRGFALERVAIFVHGVTSLGSSIDTATALEGRDWLVNVTAYAGLQETLMHELAHSWLAHRGTPTADYEREASALAASWGARGSGADPDWGVANFRQWIAPTPRARTTDDIISIECSACGDECFVLSPTAAGLPARVGIQCRCGIGAITHGIAPLLFTTNDAATPAKLEQAKKIFDGLQHGAIDRSLFTDNANAYFSEQALKDFASGLEPLGPPQQFVQLSQSLRGGMTLRVYMIRLGQKTLRAWTYEMPDGKLEQYQIAPQN